MQAVVCCLGSDLTVKCSRQEPVVDVCGMVSWLIFPQYLQNCFEHISDCTLFIEQPVEKINSLILMKRDSTLIYIHETR
jgi:hypothetical protein